MPGKSHVAVIYSPQVGGMSVLSLIQSFKDVGCEVDFADYREFMRSIPIKEFNRAYHTLEGRKKLFAHAKAKATQFLDQVDCLALSGNAAMIDPVFFNQKRDPEQRYDPSRTIAELALIHVATQRGMPIIGICGGHQVVAVYGGGSVRDLTSKELPYHRYLDYDDIKLQAETMLHRIMAPKELTTSVFGAHHQVVDRLGKGFRLAATGADGKVIEAAETEFGAPVITTQFHAEIMAVGFQTQHSPDISIGDKKGDKEQVRLCENIFQFFRGAAETYHNKKKLLSEFKQKNTLIEEAEPKLSFHTLL